jgi:hypothetical protein
MSLTAIGSCLFMSENSREEYTVAYRRRFVRLIHHPQSNATLDFNDAHEFGTVQCPLVR